MTTCLCQGNPRAINDPSLLNPPDDHTVKSTGCLSAIVSLKRDRRASSLACLGILHDLHFPVLFFDILYCLVKIVTYVPYYLFKVAISNSRIIKVEDGKAWFRYQKPHSNRWRIMALDIMEFMRRFLQHVLPTGFMKVRHYGFISPACPGATSLAYITIDILTISLGYIA